MSNETTTQRDNETTGNGTRHPGNAVLAALEHDDEGAEARIGRAEARLGRAVARLADAEERERALRSHLTVCAGVASAVASLLARAARGEALASPAELLRAARLLAEAASGASVPAAAAPAQGAAR